MTITRNLTQPLTRPIPHAITQAGAGSGVFSPESVPSLLAWYDPSDLSTLFQDVGGTVPVTASGDTVRRMLDKSGNGNHATVAAGSTLQADGGVYWIAGGVIKSEAAINLSAGTKFSYFHATRLLSSGSIGFAALNGNGGDGTFSIRHRNGAAGDTAWALEGVGLGLSIMQGRTMPFGLVNGVICDISQAVFIASNGGPQALQARYNGVPSIHAVQGGAYSSGPALANAVLSIKGATDGSFPTDLHFYGAALYSDAVSESEAEQVEAFLDAKAGGVIAGSKAVYSAVLGDSITAEYSGQSSVPSHIRYADGAPAVGGIMLAAPGRTTAQAQTAWESITDYSRIRLVTIQIGSNDTHPGEAASVAIARIQSLVDSVNARKPAGCKLYICQITSRRADAIATYGAVDGEISNDKRLAMNVAIAGGGATPITGVDRVIVDHVTTMTDGSGNLAAAYDTGDGVHPNNAGRLVNANAIRAAMVLDGLLP